MKVSNLNPMKKGRYFFAFIPKISPFLKDFIIVFITIFQTFDILTNYFFRNEGNIINNKYCI